MASILERLHQVKRDPGRLIDAACVEQACVHAGHRWRRRTLGPVQTLAAMLMQTIHGNTSMSHLVRLCEQRFSESGFCQARARLPVDAVRAALKAFTSRAGDAEVRWHGHRVVLIDGSGISTPDTPALRSCFGVVGGTPEGCGLPCAKTLAVFRAGDGVLLDMHVAPLRTGDLRHADELHPAMRPGDVLVGDRGLSSYVHLAQLIQGGYHGLFRMREDRNMSFPARRKRRRLAYGRHHYSDPILVRRISSNDQVVELFKPHNRPAHLTPAEFAAIPGRLTVRVVRYTVRYKGFRSRRITLLTTLTDPDRITAKDLAELYMMRWRVEINFRHLKRTIGMDRLKSQSVDGVMREMLALALIYNAVCHVRAVAAEAQEADPTRLSFIDALRVLSKHASEGHLSTPLHPPTLKHWPLRPGRIHPRQLKRQHSHFPSMHRSRQDYIRWMRSHTRAPI